MFEDLKREAPDFTFVCRENGIEVQLRELRSIKDAGEIDIYREAASITNEIIAELVQGF